MAKQTNAFSHSATSQINENIRALFLRVKEISKKPLSHEDFSALFIPAEHRQMYRDVSMLGRTGQQQRVQFKWGDTELLFKMNMHDGQYPLVTPRDMVLQHDAPAGLVEGITMWLATVGNASRDFGRVNKVFHMLNGSMTKGQIRFVWPSILAILGVTPVLSEQLKSLQELRIPATSPDLLPGLLQACRVTAATIATVALIPNDLGAFAEGAGCVEVVDGQDYEEPGIGEFCGLA